MAKRSPSEPRAERPPTARLFVALDPSDADRESLAAWRDALVAGREDLRPVPAETLHLTLAFLGHLPESEIQRTAEAALDAVTMPDAPIELDPLGVVGVPRRGPRLFALDLADPGGGAAAIQAAVSERLAAAGLYEPERRQWWPHITLARVRARTRARALDAARPAGPLRAAAVTLYRSRLSPRGARYEALERRSL